MKTQKIKRKDLLEIYNNVCDDWKEEITKLVLFQTTANIEVNNELIERAYNEADSSQKKLLEKFFKFKEKVNLKNIKSFDDILKISNKKLSEVLIFEKPKTEREVKLNAHSKLLLIEKVLNDNFKVDWLNHNQYKYYPYFKNSGVGLVFYVCGCIGCGCRSEVVCYKTRELGEFAGKTFLKEYNEFNTGIIV